MSTLQPSVVPLITKDTLNTRWPTSAELGARGTGAAHRVYGNPPILIPGHPKGVERMGPCSRDPPTCSCWHPRHLPFNVKACLQYLLLKPHRKLRHPLGLGRSGGQLVLQGQVSKGADQATAMPCPARDACQDNVCTCPRPSPKGGGGRREEGRWPSFADTPWTAALVVGVKTRNGTQESECLSN